MNKILAFHTTSTEPKAAMTAIDGLRLWHRVLEESLRKEGRDLSVRQMAIMLTAYLAPPPHSVKTLSERLNISKPAVCRAIKALNDEGLVKKKQDEGDRRNIFVQRTVKGSVYLSEFGDIVVRTLTAASS